LRPKNGTVNGRPTNAAAVAAFAKSSGGAAHVIAADGSSSMLDGIPHIWSSGLDTRIGGRVVLWSRIITWPQGKQKQRRWIAVTDAIQSLDEALVLFDH